MKGNIMKRGPDTWRLRYDTARQGEGKRRQLTETVHGTKKDAERRLRELIHRAETGLDVPRTKETVTQYMDRWLSTYAATNTSPRTQQGYRGVIHRYVVPEIGGSSLQRLSTDQIQGLYGRMTDRGLSPRTVLQVHRILKEALGLGVTWGLLARNPADSAVPPRVRNNPPQMWDASTVSRFIDLSEPSPYGYFFRFAVLTGMRRSELAGLKWEDVRLDDARLSVVRTLQRITGMGLVEGLPKTAKSRRSIALSSATVDLLHSVRGEQIERRIQAGDAWQETGYVFTTQNGRPIDPDGATQAFTKLIREKRLPHISLHGLRHAHATLMLSAGVHPKVVSERLGHSNIGITLDTYSHVLPDMQEDAVSALDRTLAAAKSNTPGD